MKLYTLIHLPINHVFRYFLLADPRQPFLGLPTQEQNLFVKIIDGIGLGVVFEDELWVQGYELEEDAEEGVGVADEGLADQTENWLVF